MAMPRAVDYPLVVGRVIGDVLDMFVPTVDFKVEYGTTQVTNGCEIKPSSAAEKPRVHINGSRHTSNLYTLVMVDPDAPSPTNPTYREWLHWLQEGHLPVESNFIDFSAWIVIDIPERSNVTEGKEVVPYMGPAPPSGIHRYVFAVFKQKAGMAMEAKPPRVENRRNFSTRNFASENDLGLPVAALYFISQNQAAAND